MGDVLRISALLTISFIFVFACLYILEQALRIYGITTVFLGIDDLLIWDMLVSMIGASAVMLCACSFTISREVEDSLEEKEEVVSEEVTEAPEEE